MKLRNYYTIILVGGDNYYIAICLRESVEIISLHSDWLNICEQFNIMLIVCLWESVEN